ncbi:YgaP family membrane protein [Desulfobacterota bacterium M19]
MVVNDWVHFIAGAFILISLGLGVFINPNWFWFTAFVGANLMQFGFSKVCPLAMILKKLGVPESRECR